MALKIETVEIADLDTDETIVHTWYAIEGTNGAVAFTRNLTAAHTVETLEALSTWKRAVDKALPGRMRSLVAWP